MTSAARPTFLPAMGGYSLRDTQAAPIGQQSAKALNSHTKMKFRKPSQGLRDASQTDLKKALLEKERAYKEKSKKRAGNGMLTLDTISLEEPAESHDQIIAEQFKDVANLDKDDSCSDDAESDDSDDDSDEDDTAELMRELEKIKQERALEQERQEREAREREAREMEEKASARFLTARR
ncbi:hypothetical protein HDV03_001585 [Kappamyces sp. JEL0829]|nr:hypothetical protein HDV03_001585 [Kappamyces sp. JEL0829]KAJ3355065.1 hypothetical protein HDU91_005706 [Kappamyces sp. JEL0680]